MEKESKFTEQLLAAFSLLEQQRETLWALLDTVDEEKLKVPEKEGAWSVNQVLVHISNAEKGTTDYINYKIENNSKLSKTGLGAKLRYGFLKGMLKLPLKYKLPKQLAQPSNEVGYLELKEQFQSNRSALKDLIENISIELASQNIFKHPFLGRFNLLQTVEFLKEHVAHHEIQIKRIIHVVNS